AYNRQHHTQFLTVIPATLYGPHDHFDDGSAHVLSALIRRFHACRESPVVIVWGSGKPVREFLYVDDLVEACLLLMNHAEPLPSSPINVGPGEITAIRHLADSIRALLGVRGVKPLN